MEVAQLAEVTFRRQDLSFRKIYQRCFVPKGDHLDRMAFRDGRDTLLLYDILPLKKYLKSVRLEFHSDSQ